MRIFVTGASGWIGSAVVPELLAAGHQVVGLARSDASAEAVAALGADIRRGDLEDLDSLRAGAAEADGVLHLGYHHDFSEMERAAELDLAAITVMGEALAGRDGFLAIASGAAGLASGRSATEDDSPTPGSHPRSANALAVLELAGKGVHPIVLRFAPTVHGASDHGFVATLVEAARRTGVSGYVGDGSGRWPAVHRSDTAKLVAAVVEDPTAAQVVHAIAEEGVPTREIAEAIGRALDLPTRSVAPEDALAHFGWIGGFFSWDVPVSSTKTREVFGWTPTGPTLIEDLDAGRYTS